MEEDSDGTKEHFQHTNEDKSTGKKKVKTVSAKGKRDNAIQGTNDSSIVSKRSVERTGYDIKSAQHQWFRHFVKKPARRAPLINLGYFVRMKAIEKVVDEFLVRETSRKKIVVNLGCGYDPLSFAYLSDSTSQAVFVDVDYPDLIRHRSSIIRDTPALASVVAPYFGETSGEIRSQMYYAVGCDLSNLTFFDKVLREVEPNLDDIDILFISEVAITYMPSIAADALISFTSRFPNATFAILEQILPAGPTHPFAVTMQNHFNKLNTPLHSLNLYPSLRSQGRRFLEAGYSEIEACDLNTFFNGVMKKEDRMAALEMELFDEFEELGAFLGHYFILVARNISTPAYFSVRGHDWQYIKWNKDILLNGNMTASYHCHQTKSSAEQLVLHPLDDVKRIHRRFLAIASTTNGFFIQGGLSNTTRVSSPLKLCPTSDTTVFSSSPTCPPSRMCHTLTSLGDGSVLLVGGREAPMSALNDVWLFDQQWKKLDPFPGGGIYRHTAVQIGPGQVVLFGGRRDSGQTSSNWYLYSRQKGWQSLRCDDSPSLWGASLAWDMGQGVLVGGMDADGYCSGDIYTWSIDQNSLVVRLKKWTLPPSTISLTRRYGARVVRPNTDSGFLCIGGAGSHRLLAWSEQFLHLDPINESVEVVEAQTTATAEPWLIGHDVSVQGTTKDIFILGGGGVCFSFGSFWNDRVLRIQQDDNDFSSPEHWIIREEVTPTSQQPTLTALSSQSTPIRRTCIDTPEQWQNILQSSEACVLEGLDFGSCNRKWTPEYLKLAVGPDKTVVIHSTNVEAMNFLAKNFKYTSRSFSDFIDSVFLETKEKVYLRAVSDDAKVKPARLENDFPGLAQDFNIPNVLCGDGGIELDKIFSTVLRVGSVGTSMWLHYDVMANILTQIVGEKEVIIFHPSMVNELDIPPGASSSRIPNIFTSELRNKGFSTTLKPGDAIFIPPLWPHATKPLTPNIGVNVFWKSFNDDLYDRGKDIYGNMDLMGYSVGRQLISRMAKEFKGVHVDVKNFYLKRLAAELEEISDRIS